MARPNDVIRSNFRGFHMQFLRKRCNPPFDALHQLMGKRFDERFGKGYEYIYLYPGMQKVVQAAGRLIRTHEDRGELTLIDPPSARPEIRGQLPGWWPEAILF